MNPTNNVYKNKSNFFKIYGKLNSAALSSTNFNTLHKRQYFPVMAPKNQEYKNVNQIYRLFDYLGRLVTTALIKTIFMDAHTDTISSII